jgi:hypothetical protein
MLACYEEILWEKKRSLARQTSVASSPPVSLDIGDDDPDGPSTVQEEAPPPQIVFSFSFHIFHKY